MRCLPRLGRVLVLPWVTVACLPLLSGCGTSRADFVTSANSVCEHTADRIARLDSPRTPQQALGYAIDLLADKDRALIQLNEMSLPGGDAATLRDRWLRPATHDLDRANDGVARVRRAVSAPDPDALSAELDVLRRAGTAGVDDSVLTGLGLTECLRVFGDPDSTG